MDLNIHRVIPKNMKIAASEDNYTDSYVVFDIMLTPHLWHHEQEDVFDLHLLYGEAWATRLEDLCKYQDDADKLAWRSVINQLSERRLSRQALHHASTQAKQVSDSEESGEVFFSEEYELESHSEQFEVT